MKPTIYHARRDDRTGNYIAHQVLGPQGRDKDYKPIEMAHLYKVLGRERYEKELIPSLRGNRNWHRITIHPTGEIHIKPDRDFYPGLHQQYWESQIYSLIRVLREEFTS